MYTTHKTHNNKQGPNNLHFLLEGLAETSSFIPFIFSWKAWRRRVVSSPSLAFLVLCSSRLFLSSIIRALATHSPITLFVLFHSSYSFLFLLFVSSMQLFSLSYRNFKIVIKSSLATMISGALSVSLTPTIILPFQCFKLV